MKPSIHRYCRHALAAMALVVGIAGAAASDIPPRVGLALARAGIPTESVGIWVHALDAAKPSLTHNAEQPMNPASLMKLVTAYAALDTLGPAHVWTTRIAMDGRLEGGVLRGNVYLVGGGDPLLSYERLWKLLRRIRTLGIHTIDGDLVLDGSALKLPAHDPYAFDGKGLRPYNSGPSGLLLHFNTLHLGLQPGDRKGQPVALIAHPPLRGVAIDNRITTASGGCGVWHRDLDAVLETIPAGASLTLSGSLPAGCGARDWSAAPLPAEQFATALVAALWSEIGGGLRGAVRSGAVPANATPLLSDVSPVLAEVVREMNKWSSNVIAQQLLATLGSIEPASADMLASGARLAADRLAAAGIPTAGLRIENGAGLSRNERIRADGLGQLLLAAWRRPFMPEFMAALPIAGIDGTAKRRLVASPVRAQVHLKTGTLDGVRAMAGYVLDRNGRRHAVVMIINHSAAADSQAAQDALLEWVWEGS